LFAQEWVVYSKRPFGGPQHVLHYLARYTHRVAISNHRLLSFSNGQVTFRWKDYAHHNKKRKMTVSAHEFLRRFLLHVLPSGFVRIRHFGFLANRRRAHLVALCRNLIGEIHQRPIVQAVAAHGRGIRACPFCAGPMIVIERLSAQQVHRRLRGCERRIDSS
jgi:Putative transposase